MQTETALGESRAERCRRRAALSNGGDDDWAVCRWAKVTEPQGVRYVVAQATLEIPLATWTDRWARIK